MDFLVIGVLFAVALGIIISYRFQKRTYQLNQNRPQGFYLNRCPSIGIALGLPIDLALDGIALGPAIGGGLGLIVGAVLENKNKDKLRPLTKEEKTMKKTTTIILLVLLLAGLGVFAYLAFYADNQKDQERIITACRQNQGNWLAEHQECEFISRELCNQLGGSFEECASACRHDPDAEICTMQCVPVCIFRQKTTKKNDQKQDNQERLPMTAKDDLIKVSQPLPEQDISSPLIVKGQARGTWFFEGDFPIVLTDWDGKIIAESFATAQSDWMTEEYVNFEGTLEFDKPDYGDNGFLILQKANPSGLLENADAFEIRINFE